VSKLMVCFIHRDDANRVVAALQESELRVTELRSEGGFLRAGNSTILIGVEDDQVPTALGIIDRNCQRRTEQVPVDLLGGMDANWLPTEVTHGGATVLVLPVEAVHRF
jgi:uncharacterized protein YaaQ